MAIKYKHKRYFRVRGLDNNLKIFSSIEDANTKIGFKDVFSNSSPTKTEALADSGQTLVVTYEFGSEADQESFNSAIDSVWKNTSKPFMLGIDDSKPFEPECSTDEVEHFKTEWLNPDGSVRVSSDLI